MRIENHAVGAIAKYSQAVHFGEKTQAKETRYDEVELSGDAVTFANIIKQVKARSADDGEYAQRVTQIERLVQSGSYKLDPQKIVDKLLF